MTTPPPDQPPAAETLEEIAERYVADLPRSTDCAFNVAKKGQHRFCSRMGRKRIGQYYFCQRHAEVVERAIITELRISKRMNRIAAIIERCFSGGGEQSE